MQVRSYVVKLMALATVVVTLAVPGAAAAQGNSDQNNGNPTILAEVRAMETQIAALQKALATLQESVSSLASGTSLKDVSDGITAVGSNLSLIPPSWSQKLAAADRFELVLDGAAVLDHETGLVWEKSPSKNTQTFERMGFFLCNAKNVGGRLGWRVPTLWEMLTLIDLSHSNPALPAGHPFTNLVMGNYWTATPFSVGFLAETAYAVGVDDGGSGTTGVGNFFPVWCVRGPGGVNPVNPKSP